MLEYWQVIEIREDSLLCRIGINEEERIVLFKYQKYYSRYLTPAKEVFVQIPPGKSNQSRHFTEIEREIWSNKLRPAFLEIQTYRGKPRLCEWYHVSNRGIGYINSWINHDKSIYLNDRVAFDSSPVPMDVKEMMGIIRKRKMKKFISNSLPGERL